MNNHITTPDSVLEETPKNTTNPRSKSPMLTAIVGTLLIGSLAGFGAGLAVGKSSGSSTVASQTQMGGPNGSSNQAGGRMGGFGTVSAVTSDSITVKDQMQGTSITYAITSSTKVNDDGSTAAVSDIAAGDTVMVQTADSSSTSSSQAATSITINPSMQGGPGNQNGSTI